MGGVAVAGGSTSLFLQYNNHAKVIGEEVRHSFQREDGSDVMIVCEGGCVPAHRLILATASPWLKSIFEGVSSSGDQATSTLLLPDVKHRDMLLLVQLIYCGEVTVPLMQLAVLQELIIFLQLDAGQVNEKFFLEAIQVQGMSHSVSAAVVAAIEAPILPSNISSHQGSNGSVPSVEMVAVKNKSMVKSDGSSLNQQYLHLGLNSNDASLVSGLKSFESVSASVPVPAPVAGELPHRITSKAEELKGVPRGGGEFSGRSLTFLEGLESLNKPTIGSGGTRKKRGPKKGWKNCIQLNPKIKSGVRRPRKTKQPRVDRKNPQRIYSSKKITNTKIPLAPLPRKSIATKIPTTSIILRSRQAPKLTEVETRTKIENTGTPDGTMNAASSGGDVFSSDNMDADTGTGTNNTSETPQEFICCFCRQLFENKDVLRSHISQIHWDLLEPNDTSI